MNKATNKTIGNSTTHPTRSAFQLLLTFFLALLAGTGAATTEKIPPPEKIYINADHMQLNIETGNSTYNGHVTVRQGGRVLTGDIVVVTQQNNQVERIQVHGKPATYTHVTDKNETIHATSKQMVYTTSNHLLVLTGNAKLSQPAHTVKSQRIVYDTVRKIVIAGSHKQGSNIPVAPGDRVNIILTPKTEPLTRPPRKNSSKHK